MLYGIDMTYPDLRDYQIDVRDRTRRAAMACAAPVRVILQCETGGGKSHTAVDLVVRCVERKKRALFIARGRRLVNQFARHLENHGVPHGILMAGKGWTAAPVQVASKDTLEARCLRGDMPLPEADLVIIDECHESLAKGWMELLKRYEGSVVVGLTATPARPNGRGLGGIYQAIESAIPMTELIRRGWLVPTRVFAPFVPTINNVPTENGDWNRKALARVMDRPSITGDVVSHWKRLAEGRPSVIFACTIDHSMHIRDDFLKAGIPVAHIDQSTDDQEREDVISDLENGKIAAITNVGVMRQGVDVPCLAVAVLVRPTKSFVLYRQMLGRIKRPGCKRPGCQWCPSKRDSILIDHAGAVYHHGLMPDDNVEWTLSENDKIEDRIKKLRDAGGVPEQKFCPECHAVINKPRGICPNCGASLRRATRQVSKKDGILVPVEVAGKIESLEAIQREWNKTIYVADRRGLPMISAAMIFKKSRTVFPWEIPGVVHVPARGNDWKKRPREVVPEMWRK